MQRTTQRAFEMAMWTALPMAQTSKVKERVNLILDKTRNRRILSRGIIAATVALSGFTAALVGTAHTEPLSLEASLTSGMQFPPDSPEHQAADIAFLKTALRRFGDKDPWAGKAYYVLGNAQMEAGHFDDALASYDKSISLPEPPYANSGIHSSARYERINTLDFAGRYAEAAAQAQPLLNTPGLVSADLRENLRERLSGFKMMDGYTDKRDAETAFYAAFPAPKDPRWTQVLPNGVKVQFLGCQQLDKTQHTGWTPEGKFLTQETFDRNLGDPFPMTFSGFSVDYVKQEEAKRAHGVGFALRLTYPSGVVVKADYSVTGATDGPAITGLSTENGVVVTDENEINLPTDGVRLTAANFPNSQTTTTLRVGISTGTPASLPPDAPDASYQWVVFPDITLPPIQHGWIK